MVSTSGISNRNTDAIERNRAGSQIDAKALHAAAERQAFHQVDIAIEADPLAAGVAAEPKLLQSDMEAEEVERGLARKVDPTALERNVPLLSMPKPLNSMLGQ